MSDIIREPSVILSGSVAYRHRRLFKKLWAIAHREGEIELADVLYQVAFDLVDAWEKHATDVAAATAESSRKDGKLPPSFSMNTQQVANRFGYPNTTYVKRIAEERLGGRKDANGQWWFEPAQVDAYAQEHGK